MATVLSPEVLVIRIDYLREPITKAEHPTHVLVAPAFQDVASKSTPILSMVLILSGF